LELVEEAGMTIRIVTDSTCDLPAPLVGKMGITVLPLYIHAGGQSYRDGVDLTRKEFYEKLPGFSDPPTTAAPSPDVFQKTYQTLAEGGAKEILSIHISESLSATVAIARLGAQQTEEVPVTVLDAGQLSFGTGFLVLRAAEAVEEGRSLQEILQILEEQITRTRVFAALDTLEYLRRSGRMHWSMARLGSLLRIKPILKMYAGKPESERVRTRGKSLKRILALLEQAAPLERVALVHTNDPEAAEDLRHRAKKFLEGLDVPSVDITPVLGAHLGPGAVGFATVSRKG
jgi:DegV family protein with EDD domain